MSVSDVKAKLLKLDELERVEHAMVLCESATRHKAMISRIQAQDEAESERSVELDFTPAEGEKIFAFIETVLAERRDALKAELGA